MSKHSLSFPSVSGDDMPPLKGCWERPRRWWRHPRSSSGPGTTDTAAAEEQTHPVPRGANHIPMCRDSGPLSTEAGPDLVWDEGVPKKHKIGEVSRPVRTKGGGPGEGACQQGAGRVQRPRGGTGSGSGRLQWAQEAGPCEHSSHTVGVMGFRRAHPKGS